MARRLAQADKAARVAGLVLLAPAPDFTTDLVEPKLTDAQRDDLAGKGFFFRDPLAIRTRPIRLQPRPAGRRPR